MLRRLDDRLHNRLPQSALSLPLADCTGSQAKTDEIIRDIETSFPNLSSELIFLRLVLDDLTTVRRSAEEFLGKESRLDVLWNNSGVMLGINNPGHFLFTYFLRPILAVTARTAPRNSVRVIWVSSSAADSAPHPAIDFTNMDYHREEGIWSKYLPSKAGNVLYSAEFARRTADECIISLKLITHHPKKGPYTELFAGLSLTITEHNNGGWARKDLVDPELGRKYWEWSEEQVKAHW
ncbi:short-chain dehydrogenase [Leptodontidium sp. MPI-SDFR-AT-0119]|nr:short-chain dehydrogenase [Leptodontidium sp. MPI-SDFR-AT-0119]